MFYKLALRKLGAFVHYTPSNMNFSLRIKYILAAIAIMILGGLAYAGVKPHTPHRQSKQELQSERPAEVPVEATKQTTSPSNVPVPATASTPAPVAPPLAKEVLPQTPWRQGPSDQAPTPPGGGGSGSTLPIEDVPWGQGPSDQ